MDKQYISTTEAADILGISRIAVFKKIKKGEIKAKKIGRNFAIAKEEIVSYQKERLDDSDKREIDRAVKKTMKEYGETIKLLGDA